MLGFDFAKFVALAVEEGYTLTPNGVNDLFELFEHLAGGGTILDFPREDLDPSDAQGMLGMAWLDTSRYVRAVAQAFPEEE